MTKKDIIDKRVKKIAMYFVENKSTIRATAQKFGVSKSTVHKDLRERLPSISPLLYEQVSVILEQNASEATMRGGIATQKKHLLMKKQIHKCN